MKNFKPYLLILLLINSLSIHSQNPKSKDEIEKIKKSITQELYVSLNEKSDNPLLLINGFIWGNDTTVLSVINPNDIKDLSVLKDNAAKITYGENGKNGVLVLSLKDISINSLEKFKTAYGLQNSNSKEQKTSGIIYDNNKNPIPNAFISNINRKESFKSDSEGKYELTARENDILVYFLSGFKSKIVKVKDTTIDIILESNPQSSIQIR